MSQSLLPSVLPSRPAVSDVTTTPEQLQTALGLAKVTSPQECAMERATPIENLLFASADCFRLFPSRERVMAHRKRDHNSSDWENTDHIITWND
ncbi:hypothetical protein B0H16DRAFT_1295108 [Mycena metata]|uniref:Uncharacterized protein n=1 Tax=Mycena metata TaxID=1033252 RepID=A0AAD7P3C0_9AGAR|nr:hypothetical protein B0H16DRAFT_1295108 [Mycena metata]